MEGAGGKLLSRLSAFWLKALNALIEESLIGKMVKRNRSHFAYPGDDSGVPCLTVIQRMTALNGSRDCVFVF